MFFFESDGNPVIDDRLLLFFSDSKYSGPKSGVILSECENNRSTLVSMITFLNSGLSWQP